MGDHTAANAKALALSADANFSLLTDPAAFALHGQTGQDECAEVLSDQRSLADGLAALVSSKVTSPVCPPGQVAMETSQDECAEVHSDEKSLAEGLAALVSSKVTGMVCPPRQVTMAPTTQAADIPSMNKFYDGTSLVTRKIAENTVSLAADLNDDAEWGNVADSTEDDKLLKHDVNCRHKRLREVDSRCLAELEKSFNAAGKFDTESDWQASVVNDGDDELIAELRLVALMGTAELDGVGRGLALITKARLPGAAGTTHCLHLFLMEETASFEGEESWGEQRCFGMLYSDSIRMSHKSQHDRAVYHKMVFLDGGVFGASMSLTEKSKLSSATDRVRELPCCACPVNCCTCPIKCTCTCNCSCCSWKTCFGSGGNWKNSAQHSRQIDAMTERIQRELKDAQAELPDMGPQQVQYYQQLEITSFRCIKIALLNRASQKLQLVTLVAHPMEGATKVMRFEKLVAKFQGPGSVAGCDIKEMVKQQSALPFPMPADTTDKHKFSKTGAAKRCKRLCCSIYPCCCVLLCRK
eukprot:TRINITY_DN16143_c1_g2_i1.p1 TRINITY_DN16143_c1_g2~~TRINITY_DN16143_c1_g2_i1.p1  ORF type:complete len:594 (+),score=104.56 TRINITY_DN16143_c1_g2_i1:206-1783(+)